MIVEGADIENLIIDVLTARTRLGLTSWECSLDFFSALETLTDRGVVHFERLADKDVYRVSFTDEGKKYVKALDRTPLESAAEFWRATAWDNAKKEKDNGSKA